MSEEKTQQEAQDNPVNEDAPEQDDNLDHAEVTYKDETQGSVEEEPPTRDEENENGQEAEGVNAEEAQAAEEGAAEDSKVAELEAEVEMLKKQAEESKQRYLRAQADFENFRRRTRAEKEELSKYGSMSVLEKLLPVVDNFDRALDASRQNDDFNSLLKGLEMIHTQFSQILEEEDLKPIQAVGQPFNPEFHQAVMQVESEEHEEGIVVEELQKGYMLKEKVIRPSMVKVSQ